MEMEKNLLVVLDDFKKVLDGIQEKLESINHQDNLEGFTSESNKIRSEISQKFKKNEQVLNDINRTLQSELNGLKESQQDFRKVVNETKHIYLFGEESKLTFKWLIVLIVLMAGVVSLAIHLPPFLNNHDQIEQERETYKVFYEYIFLKQLEIDESKGAYVEEIIDRIKNREEAFVEEYNYLNEEFKKAMRIRELKNELKNLE